MLPVLPELPELPVLPAHVAVLDSRFYRGTMFPARYKNGAFIAYHGSWNRAQRIGYSVASIQSVSELNTSTRPIDAYRPQVAILPSRETSNSYPRGTTSL